MRYSPTSLLRVVRWLVPSAAVLLVVTPARAESPQRFVVIPLWIEGSETDRPRYDMFLDCLFTQSTLEDYFAPEKIAIAQGASQVLARPSQPLDSDHTIEFVRLLASNQILPPHPTDATPVYLIFGDAESIATRECGEWSMGALDGKLLGVGLIRTKPSCWPGTEPLRNETQVGAHELVEAIDGLLGYAGCSGDGACQGNLACPAACTNFVGLACSGAPIHTFTGCDKNPIDGWVVQRFAHAGRSSAACAKCNTCDFTPHLRQSIDLRSDVPDASSNATPSAVRGGCSLAVRPHTELGYLAIALLTLAVGWLGRFLRARRTSVA